MPKYFFHIEDGSGVLQDEEGIDLADLDHVRKEATSAARQVLGEMIRAGQPLNGRSFIVQNELGETVLTYPLKLALPD